MTSSSAILYPTLKGLEQSNSSFVQVSQPVREMNRNLLSYHRGSASRAAERLNKTKTKQNEIVERKDEFSINRRRQNEYPNNIERLVVPKKTETVDDEDKPIEKSIASDKIKTTTNGDLHSKLKIEKSQQYDVGETGINADICSLDKVTLCGWWSSIIETATFSLQNFKISEEGTELSLTKPESIQSLINKHPKHTIIINNTFINRPTEQDEFLAKFSPAFYNKNQTTVGLVRDILPSATEHLTESPHDAISLQKTLTDVQSNNCTDNKDLNFVNDLDDDTSSIPFDGNAPFASIVTAILWIILILFWFMLYLKVLSVYNPLPRAIPEPKPTNYELCLLFFRRFGFYIGQLWKF